MAVTGSLFVSFLTHILFICRFPVIMARVPSIKSVVAAEIGVLFCPIARLAVTDPKVIITAKSKKVIWERPFLPINLATNKISRYAIIALKKAFIII
jgi:hypothetical protein